MSEYLLTGRCNQCGDCCRRVVICFPNSVDPADDADYRRWLCLHTGVTVSDEDDGFAVEMPLQCGQLIDDPVVGHARCAVYEHRPQLCRDWPYEPADLDDLPRCSLRFVEPSA